MNIQNWKTPGKTPKFGKYAQFRKEITAPDFESRVDKKNEYVAIYNPKYRYIDVDWKCDFEPTDEQKKMYDDLKSKLPWYPSMTKKRWGCHMLIPRENFDGIVGEPKLPALCSGSNVVEVLGDKPAIIKASLLKSHSLNLSHMSPPTLRFEDFGGKVEAQGGPLRSPGGAGKGRSPIPRGAYKACPELRQWVSHWSPERFHDYKNWFAFTCIAKVYKDKELWEDKSKTSPKYDPEKNERIWDSIHDTSYTLGTAIRWAKQDNPAGCCQYQQVKERLENDGYALEKRTGCLLLDGDELKEPEFKRLVATYRYFCPDKEKMMDIYPTWIRDEDRKEVRRVFKPYPPNKPDPALPGERNTAPPFTFTYNPNPDPKPLNDFKKICRALTSSDEEAEYQLHFMAHILQYPMENPQVLVCNKGSLEGAGKDTMSKVFRKILGDQYFGTIDNPDEMFKGKGSAYNDVLKGKLLILMNEVVSKDARAVWSQIKHFVTSDTNTIQKRYLQPIEELNCARLMIASNEANPADVGRRPFITNVSLLKSLPQEFFKEWYENIKNPRFRDDLASGLLHVDLPDIRKPPMTDVKLIKTEEKTQAIHRLFQFIVEGERVQYTAPRSGNECFKKVNLIQMYNEQLVREGVKIPKKDLETKLNNAVNEFNEAIKVKPVNYEGKSQRMYVFDKDALKQCLERLGRWSSPEQLQEIEEMGDFY